MPEFDSNQLPADPDAVAPDGTDVRILLQLEGGSMAHFELPPSQISRAVAHRTVSEIWYILGGVGEMWRLHNGTEETIALHRGLCLTLPVGTHFQFRSSGDEPLSVIGVTMPAWPGHDEAYEVQGKWTATL